jgi:hypothetical protein
MAPIDALLRVGLFVKVKDGYELPDYHANGNETREVVLQRREAAKARAKAGGKARWQKTKPKPKVEEQADGTSGAHGTASPIEPQADEDEPDDIDF